MGKKVCCPFAQKALFAQSETDPPITLPPHFATPEMMIEDSTMDARTTQISPYIFAFMREKELVWIRFRLFSSLLFWWGI